MNGSWYSLLLLTSLLLLGLAHLLLWLQPALVASNTIVGLTIFFWGVAALMVIRNEASPAARPRGIRAAALPKESAPPIPSRTPSIPAASSRGFTGRNKPL